VEFRQLALNRHVLEQVKEGKKPSISNDDKVDLDYLADYFGNIISMIEKEIKKKPKTKDIAFRLWVEIRG